MARQILFAIAGLALAFWAGWTGANWQRDSVELVAERAAGLAADKARSQLQGVASESARALEVKLEELKGAIPDGLRTEVVKPVFTNVCVSDDFVRMYNEASEKAERTLSGKSKN
ncbi:hypothetical protein [Pantoea sp. SORGH_AS_0659]|uniref:hypothetical protein n=1 Tax=Pantoea sp. SORGH_AS_0659 TaxID=3062597 RepID=UPI00285E5319|nr:hypothetical protein [Pantoea sp. SORGH_AS_0659]MDR6350695.1 hypothetical protein [Pantoea sp. SORGH_AS_0659]